MFDPRNNLSNEVSAQLIEHFGDKVFRTMIPRNVRLAEAPSFGKPALFHDKESRGALAYLALAGEMIRRDDQPARVRAGARIIGACSCNRHRFGIRSMSGKKPSLGRGLAELSPLLAKRTGANPFEPAAPAPAVLAGDRLASLPVDLLQRGKYQPRVDMRPETLSELADSIKSQGLVQPILVRPLGRTQPRRIAALRNHRRRAAMARGANGGAFGDPGGYSRRARRSRRMRWPSSRTFSGKISTRWKRRGAPALGRRIRIDPSGRRRGRGALARRREQLVAADGACG